MSRMTSSLPTDIAQLRSANRLLQARAERAEREVVLLRLEVEALRAGAVVEVRPVDDRGADDWSARCELIEIDEVRR